MAAAVVLLETDGPSAMTTRKVAAQIDSSSMSVYTDFGSMGGLVAAVVERGFTMLGAELDRLRESDDVLADLWSGLQVARAFALEHRHLYSVMFAAESLGGYQRTGDELRQGIETLRMLSGACRRACADGVFTVPDPWDATRQVWVTMHGFFMLELAGYLPALADSDGAFAEAVRLAMTGLGAPADLAQRAVGSARGADAPGALA